jgi:predicted O-linked N-acetylglucosamine transferase (SPINDLY family)
MAKKKAHKQKTTVVQNNRRHGDALGVPQATAESFMALYNAKKLPQAQQAAQQMVDRYPESAFAWKALGTAFLEAGNASSALAPLLKSYELNAKDALTLTSLAAAYYRQGNEQQAISYQAQAVELQPEYGMAQYKLAEMLQSVGKQFKALEHAQKALSLNYDELLSRLLVGALQYQTKYFSEALKNYHILENKFPGNPVVFNNLGNLYKDIGEYEKAERYYQKALKKNPAFAMAYSNIFFAKHYNPATTQSEIINFATGWEKRFALPAMPNDHVNKTKEKSLRIGLISSGFRLHPVGQMIATALESSRPEMHFYAYSTNDVNDLITQKIRNACRQWQQIRHLSQQEVAELIRHDQIDILIDLSGHGDGSCLQAISMRPAPLCVKWVGGLVNTMGLESIDYLLSDSIETPEGVDDQYTEKLIRLPDDYICYVPCAYAPNTTSLPALKNRYITLGCLNNAAKISAQLLSGWAILMHQLPQSHLLLRGAQYESQDFCRRIWDEMAEHGINQERILLEGPAKHQEFLETYQRIDIALDTWPYSGGLTTCEAMLMGVPVVTLPGPTFAGRHSATHLINAGLPELVTNSWDEYRQRVIELANDLPNLAVIRAGLRTILHYSPVCDAPRFAHHFNNAIRAIWMRYCEDKAPEALTFNKEGEMWFADEDKLVELPDVSNEEIGENQAFKWTFDEPIIILDNAAVLPRYPDYPKWMASGHLAVISFDPVSLLSKKVEELKEFGELHHYPHALLGDGQPAKLYATMDAEKGSTLKPLPEDQLQEHQREKLKVLAELPINTLALDSIEGLASADMLVLDDLHDAMKVLEGGEQTLKNTLLIQVKVTFQPTHERQPNLAELQHWASRNGFRFYHFNNQKHFSHLPNSVSAEIRQATDLQSADAVFLPSPDRMTNLNESQRIKLVFILHTVYRIKDMAYKILADVDEGKAQHYLIEKGLIKPQLGTKLLAHDIEKKGLPGTSDAQGFQLPEAPHMLPTERKLFKKSLECASCYFEFGSGGSTVWAIKEGLTVKGVESDVSWVNALKGQLGEKCQVEIVDIGPTKEWGFPISIQHSEKFPAYSKAIHQYRHAFDLILVDGRFRVACTMAAIQHTMENSEDPQKTLIFIHDFWNRPQYHVVLQFLEVVDEVETAGAFILKERIDVEEVKEVWQMYAENPQ